MTHKYTRNMKVTIIFFFYKMELGSAKQRDSKRENKWQRRYACLIHVSIKTMDAYSAFNCRSIFFEFVKHLQ
jgi:hypothetical protein